MFAVSSQLEVLPEDYVVAVLTKLQDGLKVSPEDADMALVQYRKFQGEISRLQNELSRPSRAPKATSSLFVQEKSFKDRTAKIIAAKEKEITDLKQKLKEYTLRLNAMIGTLRVEVDEKKSDLTDNLKPVQLAEDYRGLLDNEWETAYEELKVTMGEAEILVYLGKISWLAYEFSKEMAEQQLSELMKMEIDVLRIMSKPSYTEKYKKKPIVADGRPPMKFERDETLQLLRNYRRCLARMSLPGVRQIFMTLISRSRPFNKGFITEGVRKFIRKVVELSYLMSIQDPPMLLEWVRFGDVLDRTKFRPYSGDGAKVVGTIWPAVLAHKGGPVMSRGVVDVMYDQMGANVRFR